MPPTKRKSARAAPARRPVLGNDPFERGAAPRAAAPPGPPAPPLAAPPSAPMPHPPAGVDAPPGDGEARLADVARRTGPAAYTEELRELLVRLLPALRDTLAPLAALATVVGSPARLDEHGMDPDLLT